MRPTALPWLADVVVHRGDPDSWEVVLIQCDDPQLFGLSVRIGAAWANAGLNARRPWLAFALSDKAQSGISDYFRRAASGDPGDQAYLRAVESALPLDTHTLTTIKIGDLGQRSMIDVGADPPNAHVLPEMIVDKLSSAGLDCAVIPLDTDWMFTEVQYATGETGREEVLGWDDLYSDEEWSFLTHADRLFVHLRPDVCLLSESSLRAMAIVITRQRYDKFAYSNGLIDFPDDES